MTATGRVILAPEELLDEWLQGFGGGRSLRYKSAILLFLSYYEQKEHWPLISERFSPITLVGYRNFLQKTHARAMSTVNGHLSTWPTWLAELYHLEENPANKCSYLATHLRPQLSWLRIQGILSGSQRS